MYQAFARHDSNAGLCCDAARRWANVYTAMVCQIGKFIKQHNATLLLYFIIGLFDILTLKSNLIMGRLSQNNRHQAIGMGI